MKKSLLCVLMLLSLTACSEKKEYEQAVLEQMQQDKDINDYKIDTATMTDCVVSTSSAKMPGVILIDPTRLQAYKNYTKMLKLNSSPDPKKILEELRTDFGSAKDLAEAHANYTESVVNCVSGLVTGTEEKK
ncbi:hypothetical protein KEF85_15090 [Methylomonas paludis]|uniref:Lipoprotein n=1 Tax=Methylomonas paludis TaxID=1173101 RepID=A0A975MNK8_9GAMM|nr:hypothetical protein [Methylomonas paludis]QWF70629.1 hypothetical protein KEF85_15090 [Methylomonas paludis]